METPTPASGTPATPAPITAESAIANLSSEQLDKWAATGDLPETVSIRSKTSDAKPASSPAPDASAESSPAAPATPAASTEASHTRPASETGQPAEKGTKLKARNAELDEENRQLQERLKLRKALREELATLERPKDAKTPESSPAAAKGEWDGSDPSDPKPKDVDFETHAAYLDARDAWNDRRSQRKFDARRDVEARVGQFQQLTTAAQQRIEAYAAADPTFADSVDPDLLSVVPASVQRASGQPIGPQHVLAEEILRSEHTPQLMRHFSTDAGRAEWARLCRLPLPDLLRAFGRVEATVSTAAAPAPAAKHQSTAPKPPATLGTRTADTADPAERAVKARDMDAYVREMNKRDLAAQSR